MTQPPTSFDRIPELALDWIAQGRQVAIATVVSTWGSAPRPSGSQMLIAASGEIEGSVSGGCVEGAVVIEAQDALRTGVPVLLEFGVSGGDAFSAGLACGGEIKVLVEPVGAGIGAGQGLPLDLLEQLVSARAKRRPLTYEVALNTWVRFLREPRTGEVQIGIVDEAYIHTHEPPLRLIIAGAVHVAQALIPMAQIVGFDVVLIDPRGAFATPDRFPDVTIFEDYPDDVLSKIGIDHRTAVVTLAHDPKIDDPALEAGFNSDAFYIGALGSRRTQGQRLERLSARGYGPEQLRRIHGPVGLDIGALGPAEIAVSIMAELVARHRRPR
ncbi:xanthine dehydrogenase accessory factor [Aliiroseovarius halocynthiae]|uniref:XdhC family protein n=1 Tax=Aliiroseovarius halocynthiae TaxID=985055 RepID=A0A545SMD1_9RHOB|nr:XdhC/CoxI family protein [Aliiroseovarius halocynthiae]TQV66113.1 XdhC family protein [Aliiroseovarius halocynthiae]SMR83176.1 xanthine dehydrogenase accessory factor [Aliiroseovarius halocynthiae]